MAMLILFVRAVIEPKKAYDTHGGAITNNCYNLPLLLYL